MEYFALDYIVFDGNWVEGGMNDVYMEDTEIDCIHFAGIIPHYISNATANWSLYKIGKGAE